MCRRLIVSLVVAALSIVAALAADEQHPNVKKGFAVDSVFQIGELDHVNAFNGNLVVQIPIGPRITVGGRLSYGLTLTYNSKVWDYEPTLPGNLQLTTPVLVHPTRVSNAGLGWLLSLGRILYTNAPANQVKDLVYESPDGGQHRIYCTLHEDEYPDTPCAARVNDGHVQGYTRDGTYLRMRMLTDTRAAIDFPDGTTHYFDDDLNNQQFRLSKMEDRFGNSVNIAYSNGGKTWTITDSGSASRITVVVFEDTPPLPGGSETRPKNYDTRVKQVEVPQWNTSARSGYVFTYDDNFPAVTRGCVVAPFVYSDNNEPHPPELRQITHAQTLTTYKFQYLNSAEHSNPSDRCGTGSLKSMEIPTGATFDYTYQTYRLPTAGCTTDASINETGGLRTRVITDVARGKSTHQYKWTYEPTLTGTGEDWTGCNPGTAAFQKSYKEAKSVITRTEINDTGTHDLQKTTNYFSVWSKDTASSDGFKKEEYGLPLTHSQSDDGKFLSTIVSDPADSNADITSYVRYEVDPKSRFDAFPPPGWDRNRRVQASRVKYEKDGKITDTTSDPTSFDGLGHYRTTTTGGNFDGQNVRVATTNYNPGKAMPSKPFPGSPSYYIPTIAHDAEWLLETYDSRTATEGTSLSATDFCFDVTKSGSHIPTGFLQARRTRGAADKPQNDLLAVFEPDDDGNVAHEKYYGGDKTPTSASGCKPGSDSPQFDIAHTYRFGTLASTTYTGSGYFSVDNSDIDKFTGFVSATRDSIGLVTKYQYDAVGRVTRIDPQSGGPHFKYTYGNFGTSSSNDRLSPTVDVQALSSATSSTPLDRKVVRFDSLGRVWYEYDQLPATAQRATTDNWSVRSLEYDGQNRQLRVFEREQLATATKDPASQRPTLFNKSEFVYDYLGRPTQITAPDKHLIRYKYTGSSKTDEVTRRVNADGSERDATVTRVNDRFGRLTEVHEFSGGTDDGTTKGREITTNYTYDVNNQLLTVSTDAGKQPRTFEYDKRGLLHKEHHPENGDTIYADYDARGNAGSRTTGGIVTNYDYDAGERVEAVSDQSGKAVKSFTFGRENDGNARGKLLTATRRNDLTSAGRVDVTERYEYNEIAGQMSKRTTTVEHVEGGGRTQMQAFAYSMTYDDLLLPRDVVMPCHLPDCSLPAGALAKITNERTAGYLTGVAGFASLTYNAAGMVENVIHTTPGRPTDKYAMRDGMPRPSQITFSPCGGGAPTFLPGAIVVKANPLACGLQVTWPLATVCNGVSSVRYRVLRDDRDITSESGQVCLTDHSYIDRSAQKGVAYTYTIVAEGPAVDGGTGKCQGGLETSSASVTGSFTSCDTTATLTVDAVLAYVGIPATYTAKLVGADGPVRDEPLIFTVNGQVIGRVRTAADGTASVTQALDIAPKVYEGGIKVTYAGTLLPPMSTVADLRMICGFASYTVKPNTLNVRPAAGSYGVFVGTSDRCSWMPESLADFLAVRPPGERAGTSSFNIDVTKNPITAARNGSVRVATQEVSVSQSGTGCSYRFAPEIAYVASDPRGVLSMDISTAADCTWSVSKDSAAQWLHFAPPPSSPSSPPITSGNGPATIYFTVDKQDTAEKRSAQLTIQGEQSTATGYVNQSAPLPGVCPGPLTMNLDGGSVHNGQYISLRVNVNVGTELEYHWYANDRPLFPACSSCPAYVFHPGDSGYPAPGQTSTFMVEVRNNSQACGGVVSERVSWTNTTAPGRTCKVPIIAASVMYGDAPGDSLSPRPGFPVRLFVFGDHAQGGTDPLTFQWYAGAAGDRSVKVPHDPSLPDDVSEVSPFRTSFYWCEVTDACGSNYSRTGAVYVTPGPQPRRRTVSHDFTGDRQSDVLWHNPTTQQNELWTMNGTAHIDTVPLPLSAAHAEMQSTGDINADGNTDVVWRDPTTGKNEVWIMNRTRVDEVRPLPSRIGEKWTIGAVADYDNDNHDDIVWHNSATGENEMWFQSGTDKVGTWALPNSGGNVGIYGTADFNNDEKPDLFLHNRATGENQIWIMDDASRLSMTSNANGATALPRRLHMTSKTVTAMSDTSWTPVLVADMNGDGQPDIVWRNGTSGENRVWLMNGTTVVETVPVEPRSDTSWQIGGGGMGSSSDTTPTVGDGGPVGQTATSLVLTVDATSVGKPAPATATLTSNGVPVAQRELVFRVSGSELTHLITDATGSATAVIETTDRAAGRYPGAVSVVFEGDSSYNASSATADLVIASQTPLVTWNDPAPMAYGEPLSNVQLNATATAPGTFVYTPASGSVPEAGYQTLSVTFTPTDATLAAITKLAVVFVDKAASTISWSKPAAIRYGVPLAAAQLNATSSMSGTFVYAPDAGTLLPVGAAQTLRVTFTPDNPNFEKSSATTTIDVGHGSQYILWDAPQPITVLQPLGATQLNAHVIASGSASSGQLSYDPPAGTLLTAGVHALRVTAAATTEYESAGASVDVVVRRVMPNVQWSAPAPIVYGTPLSAAQLNATADVAGGFFYALDPGTILDAGSYELFVTFVPTDARYETTSAVVTLEVLKATQSIAWAPPAPIVYGTTLGAAQLNATATVSGPAPAGTLTYLPPFGTLLQAGSAQTLTVRAEETGNYESATAAVTIDVQKATPAITWPAPAPIVYGTPLGASQLNATADVAGAFAFTPAAGTILDAGSAQPVAVHFTPADSRNYNAADMTRTIDVAKAKQSLTWATPAAIVYGTPLSATQLNATVQVVGPAPAGALSYAPAAGTILDAGAAQTLTVTADETRNYEKATKSVTIDVAKAKQSLTWATPAAIVYGTPLSATQLNATVQVVGPAPAGALSYAPGAGTILDAGAAQTLTVTADETPNYDKATKSVTIDVAKAKQSLTWSGPTTIVYGTPLSATQLNATVQVVGPAAAGALSYAPASGTVLDAGPAQTLTVTADETRNYEKATKSVTINVARAPLTLRVDAKTKLYGGELPAFTGTLTGVVNRDSLTPSYATTATGQSGTGTYPITASILDPAHRLSNYDVTITPATLTILPAPLQIAANAVSKQYSDPVPLLTATFTGLVLGETPSSLAGTLSIATTADALSAPGTYPITIGGLSSQNYAITYVGSTLTVTPEDARVVITSPPVVSVAPSGATSVTLAATVQDISATASAAGDTTAGDIRKATLTFIDRVTGATLCTAAIGVVQPSDTRTGVVTCTFARDFGSTRPATLRVAAVVSGYYARNDAADDQRLTIAATLTDRVDGGGKVIVSTAAGLYAPDAGSDAQFEINFRNDSNGAVSGSIRFVFDRTENGVKHKYELSPVAMTSLALLRTNPGGTAFVVGSGTIVDATTKQTVVATAPFIVTASDTGVTASGDHGSLSVTLLKPDGGIFIAAGWNGVRAVEQPVQNGNIQIGYGK
jgi:YD repeat-containing protein